MKESIYTIPLNDVFSVKDGCPICRMRKMLEERCIEYIMGAAMMEPDIRIETNKYGFCGTHFDMMLKQKNRLSLALMLETHLDELLDNYMPASPKEKFSPAHTCFVCKEIDGVMEKLLRNTARTAAAEPEFAARLFDQPYFCFEHYELLCSAIRDALPKKHANAIIEKVTETERAYFKKLREDVHTFTTTFDYRATPEQRNSVEIKLSVERAIEALR